MDAATINAKIYAGRGKAALRLGYDCNLFRPTTAANPFSNGIRTTLKAAFNAGDNSYRSPNLYGDAVWYGDFDARVTLPGDYLVRILDGQIYYVGQMQSLLPIICIDCTRSLRITRQAAATQFGDIGYSAMQPSGNVDVLGTPATLWPASILIGPRSQVSIGLPADVKQAGWRILLPLSVPITIRQDDIMTDDLGRRYAVEVAELTDLGWRINANEMHA